MRVLFRHDSKLETKEINYNEKKIKVDTTIKKTPLHTTPISIDEKELMATAMMYLIELEKQQRELKMLTAMNPLMNYEYLEGSISFFDKSIDDIKNAITNRNIDFIKELLINY